MGSRVRSDPSNLFEIFFELAKPISADEAPYVLQQFPNNYNDQEILRSVPNFAFPYTTYHASQPAEHFTFVLTDLESKFKFGFCRLSAQSSTHTCLCIVSALPWFEVFYPLLDHLAETLNDPMDRPVCLLLDLLYNHREFKPGDHVSVATVSQNEKYSFVCPVKNLLPSIPESRNLTELMNCLDVANLLLIFVSMINERRIVFVSETLSRLTACLHGAAPLLFPMYWQHLYIPVLPPHLLDYCSAPMPFLIGVHSSVMQKVRRQDLGDAVIVDVDTNSITSEHNDLESMPDDVLSSLKRHIKQCTGDSKTAPGRLVVGDGISRAFMTSLVALIGGYRDALRFRPGEQITFDPDAFVLSRPPNTQPFLNKALQLQTFQQFIADRLDMLNTGLGFSDEFDVQVNMYGDKWGTQSRYKDWLNHMKVQSKKLKRESRDKWLEFSGKVKARSKKTLKDFRLKIEDSKKDDVPPNFRVHPHGVSHLDPAKRPPRPPPPARQYVPTVAPRLSVISERTQHYTMLDVADGTSAVISSTASLGGTSSRRAGSIDRQSVDDSAVLDSLQRPSEMDLLSDPDILNAFKKSYSMEDLAIMADSSSTATDSENDLSVSWIDKSVSVSYQRNSLSPGVKIPGVASAPDFGAKCSVRSISPNSLTSGDVVEGSRSIPRPAPRQTISNRPPYAGQCVEATVSSALDTTKDCKDLLIVLDDSPTGDTEFTSPPNGTTSGSESTNYSPVPKPRLSKQSAPASHIDAQWMTAGDLIRTNSVSSQSSTSHALNRSVPNLQPSGVHSGSKGPSSSVSHRPQMNEARAMFMQSSVPPITTISPRQSSLEQFDPLSSGQLAVDNSQSSNQTRPGDEDLLKEWNLDFTPLYQGSTAVGCPVRGLSGAPRPTLNISAPSSGFVSMPNLTHPSVGVPGRYPGLGYGPASRSPWTMNMQMTRPHSAATRSPAFLMSSLAPDDSAMKSATLPPGLTPTSAYPITSSGNGNRVVESGDLVDLLMVNNLNLVTTECDLMRPASVDAGFLNRVPAAEKSSSRWEKFE